MPAFLPQNDSACPLGYKSGQQPPGVIGNPKKPAWHPKSPSSSQADSDADSTESGSAGEEEYFEGDGNDASTDSGDSAGSVDRVNQEDEVKHGSPPATGDGIEVPPPTQPKADVTNEVRVVTTLWFLSTAVTTLEVTEL